jgi:hypothetical protein
MPTSKMGTSYHANICLRRANAPTEIHINTAPGIVKGVFTAVE